MERNSPYQRRTTWKIPRSSDAEYFKYRYSSLKKKTALNTEIWSTVYGKYASFSKPWRKTAHKQKYEIASYQRSLSQTMSGFSCIPFILLTIDMSSSSRIEKFPSSYSSESAEWKLLHKKINKKRKKIKKKLNVHFLHLVNFTEFRPFHIRY